MEKKKESKKAQKQANSDWKPRRLRFQPIPDAQLKKANRQRLCNQDFREKIPVAQAFIKKCFRHAEEWKSCESMMQEMNARIGPFFQWDMAEYMHMCGFAIRMDSNYTWYVMAVFRHWAAVEKPY